MLRGTVSSTVGPLEITLWVLQDRASHNTPIELPLYMGLSTEIEITLVVTRIVAPILPDTRVILLPRETFVQVRHLGERTIDHLAMTIIVVKTTKVQRVEEAPKMQLLYTRLAMMTLVHLRDLGLIGMVMGHQMLRVNGSGTL